MKPKNAQTLVHVFHNFCNVAVILNKTLLVVVSASLCLTRFQLFQTLLEDENQGYVDLDRFQEEIYGTLNKSSDEKV